MTLASVQNLFLVGIGGFVGSVGRYLVSGWMHDVIRQPWLPAGTLAVNALGCFAIGVVAGLAEIRQLFTPEARLLVVVGLLGGFTTFSAFGYETFSLARDREFALAAANVAAQVLFGLFAVWAGYALVRAV